MSGYERKNHGCITPQFVLTSHCLAFLEIVVQKPVGREGSAKTKTFTAGLHRPRCNMEEILCSEDRNYFAVQYTPKQYSHCKQRTRTHQHRLLPWPSASRCSPAQVRRNRRLSASAKVRVAATTWRSARAGGCVAWWTKSPGTGSCPYGSTGSASCGLSVGVIEGKRSVEICRHAHTSTRKSLS